MDNSGVAKKDKVIIPMNVLNIRGVRPRRVIASDSFSKKDKAGVEKLYDALVPRDNIKRLDLNKIREVFPSFEDVDVDMIVNEAFPAFEATIGKSKFERVKKYFGIGCDKPNKNISSREIDEIIDKLRTIENAQYYICGFKDVIFKFARTLEGGTVGLSELEKAKIVRMYFVLYINYYYFVEDYSPKGDEFEIDHKKALRNDKNLFTPEELFSLYLSKLKVFTPASIFYDVIVQELEDLKKSDQNAYKDALSFAELSFDGKVFTSINKVSDKRTFGAIRGIKKRIHTEPGVFPLEIFVDKDMLKELNMPDCYMIYKTLKHKSLEDMVHFEFTYTALEGSVVRQKIHTCYEIVSGFRIAGPVEKNRFIRLIEYAAKRNFRMVNKVRKDGKERKAPIKYNMGYLKKVMDFAFDAGYVDVDSDKEHDFRVADILIKHDKEKLLFSYNYAEPETPKKAMNNDEMAEFEEMKAKHKAEYVEETKTKLGIDDEFEFKHFGIKKPVDLRKVMASFAMENGYIETVDEVDMNLIEKIILPGNEECIKQYQEGLINASALKKELGFSEDFAKMFFIIGKIEGDAIEAKLLEVKKSTSMSKKAPKDIKLLVALYCYLVEEQVPCGYRMRPIKRNKMLKPSNLRGLFKK